MASSAKLAIVQYNAGNIRSVLYALERIGVEAIVTDDVDQLRSADKVIFPGVGEASSAMAYLKARGLDECIRSLRQPVLGICLGMQLLCRHSEENDTPCLGIFDTDVRRIPAAAGLKVPHMGWNTIDGLKGPLFRGLDDGAYVYFVHSYCAMPCEAQVAGTEYGIRFASALARDNFFGVQFHPEKSAAAGQRILENFLTI